MRQLLPVLALAAALFVQSQTTALALDVVYQVIVQRFVYPGEAIIVAFALAILPYLILRGVVTRIARKL